jgi:hypothetical protein
MTPWTEDRLLARAALFGEWWTLERLHEAFDDEPDEDVPDEDVPAEDVPEEGRQPGLSDPSPLP